MGITLWQYYINEARRIEAEAWTGIRTLADWQAIRGERRSEFLKSMGLTSIAPVCDLAIQEHGEFLRPGYRARKLAFQILPDCWTTATYYLPDPLPPGRLPAVLYVCGHGQIGVLYYHPHLAMWARRGYAALVFDTIEQHDAGGDHHGTYYGRHYDWISLGYTGAGGELWNSLRALDVLASRPEVDPARIGATGISGGGAHSFFLAVADERIKAVASCCGLAMPHASIADRHLNDHCDCIYVLNIFQRCTSEFAALIAPRPLFLGFASEDLLFSRSEYLALAEQTRRIYRLYDADESFRLFEYPGPHGYRPETITAINDWFDRHVAGEPHPPLQPGEPDVDERQVTIFNGCPPKSNKMHLIPEFLSPQGSVALPATPDEWPAIRQDVLARLRREVLGFLERSDARFQADVAGDWIETLPTDGRPPIRRLAWRGNLAGMDVWLLALVRPSDAGQAVVAWCGPDETAHHLLGRLGNEMVNTTLVVVEGRIAGWNAYRDPMRWDALRGGVLVGLSPFLMLLQDMKLVLPFLTGQPFMQRHKVFLYGRGEAGAACLYQAALNETVAGVIAEDIPSTHREGAFLPGILRVLDLDCAAGLVGPRPLALVNPRAGRLNWASRLYRRLGCPERYFLGVALRQALDRVLANG